MARNDLAYIGGGLLSGIGKGLVADAAGKAARDAARAELEAEMARDVRKRDWAREDADLKHQRSQSEVTRTETDAAGNTFGITRGGNKVDLDIKGLPGGSKNQDTANIKNAKFAVEIGFAPDLKTAWAQEQARAGMSDEDKRKAAITWVMDQKNEFGEPLYDTPEKLAGATSAYQQLLDGDSEGFVRSLKKINPKEAPEPEQQAKGFFESLLPSDESAVAATPSQGRDLPGPADTAAPTSAKPQGDGTEASPFRPATQQQFDALPAGAIFINPKDGKPYRKK